MIYKKDESFILTDVRPVDQICLCEKNQNILHLQQKQNVINGIILTHLRLLHETVSSLEIFMVPKTTNCISKKRNLIRTRRSSLFNYIFGADAHDEIRSLSATVSKTFCELSTFATKETSCRG